MTPLVPMAPASDRVVEPPVAQAVGGPPTAPRRAFWTVIKVIEMRLRFIALMLGTGLVFGCWDTLATRFEKWRRPPERAHEVAARVEYYCPMHPSVVTATSAQCPTCGMSLARRVRGSDTAAPEGVLSQVRLTSGRAAQAGIRVVTVGSGTGARCYWSPVEDFAPAGRSRESAPPVSGEHDQPRAFILIHEPADAVRSPREGEAGAMGRRA